MIFKRERFRAVFRRRTDIPINLQFSMTMIQCPTCGGSFNASATESALIAEMTMTSFLRIGYLQNLSEFEPRGRGWGFILVEQSILFKLILFKLI